MGDNLAGVDALEVVDGTSEVEPGADSLVAEMVNTGNNALVDGGKDYLSEVAGIGGGANLVEDDAKLFALFAETNHGLDEVVAEGGVEPGCTDDHRSGAGADDAFFTGELGASVDGVGAGGISSL